MEKLGVMGVTREHSCPILRTLLTFPTFLTFSIFFLVPLSP